MNESDFDIKYFDMEYGISELEISSDAFRNFERALYKTLFDRHYSFTCKP